MNPSKDSFESASTSQLCGALDKWPKEASSHEWHCARGHSSVKIAESTKLKQNHLLWCQTKRIPCSWSFPCSKLSRDAADIEINIQFRRKQTTRVQWHWLSVRHKQKIVFVRISHVLVINIFFFCVSFPFQLFSWAQCFSTHFRKREKIIWEKRNDVPGPSSEKNRFQKLILDSFSDILFQVICLFMQWHG